MKGHKKRKSTSAGCKENSSCASAVKSKTKKRISKNKSKSGGPPQVELFNEHPSLSNLIQYDRQFLNDIPSTLNKGENSSRQQTNRKKPLKKQSGKKSYKASIKPEKNG